jgi:hypothetical protein
MPLFSGPWTVFALARLRWRLLHGATITLLTAVCGLQAAAPTPTAGHLLGVVTNEATRQPLFAAEITLDGHAAKTLSEKDGIYCFLDVTPGPHTLESFGCRCRVGMHPGWPTARPGRAPFHRRSEDSARGCEVAPG